MPGENQFTLGVLLGILAGWLWECLCARVLEGKKNIPPGKIRKCPIHPHTPDDLNVIIEQTVHTLRQIPSGAKAHADLQARLSDLLLWRYRWCGNLNDLDAAIASLKVSLAQPSAPTPDKAAKMGNMGVLFQARYERLNGESDLNTSIRHLKSGIEMLGDLTLEGQTDPNLGIMHGNLSMFLETRYNRHGGDPSDLDARVHHAREAVRVTAVSDPYRVVLLRDVSTALITRYGRLENLKDLNAAIGYTEAGIAVGGVIPRGVLLEDLSNYLELRFRRSNALADLESAIEHFSLSVMASDGPARIARLANFSCLLFDRYHISAEIHDLDTAIKCTKEGLRLLDDDEPSDVDSSHLLTRSNMLANLCNFLQARYSKLRDEMDLAAAAEAGELALKYIPRGHPESPGMLSNLALTLRSRYACLKNATDLQVAIRCIKEAASEVGETHPERLQILSNVAKILNDCFEASHVLRDLDEAITYAEAAVEVTTLGSPQNASKLDALASLLFSRYRAAGCTELGILEAAIEKCKLAISIRQPGDEELHAARWGRLNSMTFERYKALDSVEDLNAIIEHLKKQLALVPPPALPIAIRLLGDLSGMFMARYERLQDPQDLDLVIENEKQVLILTPEDHPSHAAVITNISFALRRRNKRLDSPRDLVSAITFAEKAVDATSHDDPVRASRLGNLSSAIHDRYDRLGDPNDLERAIKLMEQSVEAAQADQEQHYLSLSNLSILLHCRYRRHEAFADLEAAIKHTRAAVQEVPEKNHAQRLAISKSLGSYLRTRFMRLGDLHDIEEAIGHIQARLDSLPPDHPSRADVRGDLSSCFESKYRKLGDISDLETAITYGEEGLEATPKHYPLARASRLRVLSARYHLRYEKLGFMQDLDKAIDSLGEALNPKMTPQNWPSRADMLIALGTDLRMKFKRISREAVEKHEADRVLENSLRQRAFECFYEAWKCTTTTPLIRVQAVWRAVKFFDAKLSDRQSADLLEEAVNLLPSISLRWMVEGDQQRVLSQLYGLSSLAASYALKAGKGAFAALRILEFGRGVIMGYGIDQRSDAGVEDLRVTQPELAQKLHNLRAQINAGINSDARNTCGGGHAHDGGSQGGDADSTSTDQLERRKQAMAEFNDTVDQIRQVPGYSNFLRPPTKDDLMHIARYGSIVVMCATSLRSDAIIVTNTTIQSVELGELKYKETKKRMREMGREYVRGTLKSFAKRNKRMQELMLYLWERAVGPVLSGPLGILPPATNLANEILEEPPRASTRLPRIFWIGVGELSRAPFHAAGNHSLGSTDNTLSRAVSSYIPSIKALIYSRQRPFRLGLDRVKQTAESPKILLVTMATTPNEAPLPRVEQEVQAVIRVFEEPSTGTRDPQNVTPLSQPTAATVLSHLPHYDFVHFACHGVSDSIDPFQSSLLLARPNPVPAPATASAGDETTESSPPPFVIDKLTALDISRIYTTNYKETHATRLSLAYLSACSTADNSSIDLSDETIYLATAFQLAGFSHVLATLWQGKDDACMVVAEHFYQGLFKVNEANIQGCELGPRGEEWDGGHGMVARAMHDAIWQARKQLKPEKPLLWAPFIHVGA